MKLPVEYISQWDSTASLSKNDCGATSTAMVLNYYGTTCTSDEVFKKTGAGQGYITFDQLIKAVKSYGFVCEKGFGKDFNFIKKNIDDKQPPICVVHYGDIPARQDTFTGPHILVVTGYDDNGVFVNDPNFRGANRAKGANKYIKWTDFNKAWASTVDGNLANSYLLIFKKETMKPTEKLPEAFYQIKEAKELIKRKLITAKDAFDTILAKFVATSDVLEKQKAHFDEETNALIDEKEVLQDKLDGVTQDLNARNSYVTELEAKVDRLNSIISNQPTSAKGEVNSKDIVKWLKNTGWYAVLPLVITYLTVLQTNIPKEYAVIAVPLIATGIDFIKKLIAENK